MSGNSGFIFDNEPNLGAADRGGSLHSGHDLFIGKLVSFSVILGKVMNNMQNFHQNLFSRHKVVFCVLQCKLE